MAGPSAGPQVRVAAACENPSGGSWVPSDWHATVNARTTDAAMQWRFDMFAHCEGPPRRPSLEARSHIAPLVA